MLNLTAAVFLLVGWKMIKQKNKSAHAAFMSAALFASFLFLCLYLLYHLSERGVTRYEGEGMSRIIYFSILLTHTPLAILIVPFSLIAVYYALKENYPIHTRITRWLLPVWLYVSVTGVLIYVILYLL